MSRTVESICVLGLGYIGLPTAAIFASRGYRVRGVDTRPTVVDTINAGQAHFIEPELDLLVQAAVETGRLQAHSEPAEADAFILCVPTPLTPERLPDLQFVWQATDQIVPFLRPGDLVVLESTSPPGTTEEIARRIQEKTGLTTGQVHFAHAPERVLPGHILREVVENDRVIGGLDAGATEACVMLYQSFAEGRIHRADAKMAEATKLVENAYRDVNIAFANEISMLANELGIDPSDLIALANHHPRVNILQPGAGVGGHCIAIDPWFLVSSAPSSSQLIRTAREVNDRKPHWVLARILEQAERLEEPRIACLGLTYKADVDDLRESPAVTIVRWLLERDSGRVSVVEPHLDTHPEFALCGLDEALEDADIVVVLVAHREFRELSPERLEGKVVVDVCGALRR
jgi:UDP-N-acetyl-D-mannosaminuronic acid dehydrogenase